VKHRLTMIIFLLISSLHCWIAYCTLEILCFFSFNHFLVRSLYHLPTYMHVLFFAYMAVCDFYFFLQEWAQSALRAHSSSTRGMSKKLFEVPQASIAVAPKMQSFIKEEVLVST
jgi:hypothetical protein